MDPCILHLGTVAFLLLVFVQMNFSFIFYCPFYFVGCAILSCFFGIYNTLVTLYLQTRVLHNNGHICNN
jgi:hypothetical protein